MNTRLQWKIRGLVERVSSESNFDDECWHGMMKMMIIVRTAYIFIYNWDMMNCDLMNWDMMVPFKINYVIPKNIATFLHEFLCLLHFIF